MLHSDLVGFGIFVGYFIVAGLLALPLLLFRTRLKVPFEVTRKLLHMVITLSIFPLLNLFSTWYLAVLAALMFALVTYPVLAWLERCTPLYTEIAVERSCGEFKSSLVVVQLSLSLLIAIFWGLLGIDGQTIVVVAVMAWGFGDAAAALVGKAFGRRKIRHPRVQGAKTIEGSLAMAVVAGLAIFLTLLVYAGRPWYVSLPIAMLVAPVCAAVELFSPRGTDTLTVPLSTAFAMLPLVSLVSFLGI